MLMKWILRFAGANQIKMKDERFVKLKYHYMTGKRLNLKKVQTFNEKIQWLKLYDRNPEYTKMVDKYEVKKYISEIIGSEYVIPALGIYDKFDDVDFDKLPNKFVMKCTHDSQSTVVCIDKDKLDMEETKKFYDKRLKEEYFFRCREWPYKNVKPRLLIEKYMGSENQKELINYKFFCFNGKPEFLYLSEGVSHQRVSFVDMNYNKTNFYRKNYQPYEKLPEKPVHFEKMKEISKKLSKGIPFVRIDFYEIEGEIYFGEITFYPSSGYMPIEPVEYEKILGDMIELPIEKREVK